MKRSGNTVLNPGEAGFVVASRADDMMAFDALPPPVRRAVSEAPINLACAPLEAFWAGETDLDCMERLDALMTGIGQLQGAA